MSQDNNNIIVKSTLPRTASAEDKLNDIINQLQEKYQGRTIYTLWEIKKENREVNFDTVAKWLKEVNGSTLSDYLVSKGILTPAQYFDIVEKDLSVEDLKGKKCCAFSGNGSICTSMQDDMAKCGAIIVPPNSNEIDYVCGAMLKKVSKIPPDNRNDVYSLFDRRDKGELNFEVVAYGFQYKVEAYIKSLILTQEERTDLGISTYNQPQEIIYDYGYTIINNIKLEDIPQYDATKHYWSLNYFYEWYEASGGEIRGTALDPYCVEDSEDPANIIKRNFAIFANLCNRIEDKQIQSYISRKAHTLRSESEKSMILASLGYISDFDGCWCIVLSAGKGDVWTIKLQKIKLLEHWDDFDYTLIRLKENGIPATLCAIIENHANDYAFRGMPGYIWIDNTSGVIPRGAFANDPGIKYVEMSDNINKIDFNAFANCDNLESVRIGRAVEIISAGAFANCGNLKKVIIPESVKTIDPRCFKDCSNLSEVIFEGDSRCEAIDTSAFSGCTSLKFINIPRCIKTIYDDYTLSTIPRETIPNKLVEAIIGNDGNNIFYHGAEKQVHEENKKEQEAEALRKRINTLFEKLDAAYPDKVIVSLRKDHREWGKTVTDLYRKLGYSSGTEFLETYGYKVSHEKGGRPKVDFDEAVTELKRRYPEGTTLSISAIIEENSDIAKRLNTLQKQVSSSGKMTFKEFLIHEGIIIHNGDGDEELEKLISRYSSTPYCGTVLSMKDENPDIDWKLIEKHCFSVKGMRLKPYLEERGALASGTMRDTMRLAQIEREIKEKYQGNAVLPVSLAEFEAQNPNISIDLLRQLVKNVHEESVSDFLTRIGILPTRETIDVKLSHVIATLKERYVDGTQRAYSLSDIREQNLDLPIPHIGAWTKQLYGKNASEYLYEQGLLAENSCEKDGDDLIVEDNYSTKHSLDKAEQLNISDQKEQEYDKDSINKRVSISCDASLEAIIKLYGDLRFPLIGELYDNEYSSPSTEDFCVDGVFNKDPDFDVLEEICEYAVSKTFSIYERDWSSSDMFLLIKEEVGAKKSGDKYSISLFGCGLAPILVLLPFLAAYSDIEWLSGSFLHDKWEARGDYYASEHVGIKLDKGYFVICNFKEDDSFDFDAEESKRLQQAADEWMNKYGEYIDSNPRIEFAGKRFVFAGFGHETHPVVEAIIAKGGQYRTKVSGLTNYLVVDPEWARYAHIIAVIEQLQQGKNIHVILRKDLERALEGDGSNEATFATPKKETWQEDCSKYAEKSVIISEGDKYEEELRKIREDNERRVREDQERQAKEETERRAREEAERKAREEAERKAREEEAFRRAQAVTTGNAIEEAYRKALEDAERRKREVAERNALETERKAREEAERKKREEIERICREAEERRLRAEAERKAQEEAERSAREAERKAREEAERKAREEEERKAKEEAERKEREKERRKAAREEAKRKAREEEERKAREEAERKAREEAERLEQERIRAERRAKKLCQHCGGTFKGLFAKKCSNCGMKKDY